MQANGHSFYGGNTMSTPSAAKDAGRLVPLLAVLAVLLTVVLTAFAWPAVNTAPRDLPVAGAGPPAATDQGSGALATVEPGAFDVHALADERAARDAIADREVY